MQVSGKKYLIKLSPLTIDNTEYYLWEINDENTIIQDLTEISDNYSKLIHSSDTREINSEYTFGLLGEDRKTEKVRHLLQKAAITNTTILLKGESGTGKTFLAQEIHKCSLRKNKPFVHVNCAAIPYNLIESELFGY